jgi:hypothetical protein
MQNNEARKRHEENQVEIIKNTIETLWAIKDRPDVAVDKEMILSIDQALMHLWGLLPKEEREHLISD